MTDARTDKTTRPRIVVGIDGSDSSVEALRQAARIATALGATLEAIGAWHFPVLPFGTYYPPADFAPDEDTRLILEAAADTVFGSDWPDWFQVRVRQGLPAPALIAESEGADMLVVGSRGRGGFAGLLLGSVGAACASHARCPVLIVHRPAEAAGKAGSPAAGSD
jgi:nucleotide-binding universal stress UspA family protein